MTSTEDKALAMLNDVRSEMGFALSDSFSRDTYPINEVLCRAIEQYEAFRQEVSDAVREYFSSAAFFPDCFRRFIIPAPKPDPLVAMAEGMGYYGNDAEDLAEEIRAGLDALGFEIREKNDD